MRQQPRAALRGLGAAVVVTITAIATGGVILANPTAASYTDTAVAVESSYTTPASYRAVSTQFTATSTALSGGYVWIWGYKNRGMSGNGLENDTESAPKPVFGLSDVVKVVGASDYEENFGTFGALTASGEVYTWGSNRVGRLGLGTASANGFAASPQRVTFPDDERVVELGSMRATMAAMTESGKVYTWGSGEYGQAGNGNLGKENGPRKPYLVIENAHSMHVGQRLVWVVTQENEVFWWGRNFKGESGSGKTGDSSQPVRLDTMNEFAFGCEGPPVALFDPSDTCNIVQVTSSRQAGALLTADGTVRTFGNTEENQIGRPGTPVSVARAILPVEISEPVARVSAGNYHFTVLTRSGGVWGWGDNASWQATGNIRPNGTTGQGTADAAVPVRLPLSDIVAIGGSRDTSYATRADSVLIGWGSTDRGAIPGASGSRATFSALELPGIRASDLL